MITSTSYLPALCGVLALLACKQFEKLSEESPSPSASGAALQAGTRDAAGVIPSSVAEPTITDASASPSTSASAQPVPSASATASSVSTLAPPSLDPNKWYELYPSSTVPQPKQLASAAANALLKRFFPKFLARGTECPEEWLPGSRSMAEARTAGMFSPEITAALVGAFTRRGASEQLLHVRLHECSGSHAEGYGTSRVIVVEGNRTIVNEEGFGLTRFGVAADVDGDGVLEFTQVTSDTHQGLEQVNVSLASLLGGRLRDVRDLGQENIPCNAGVQMVGADAMVETFRVQFRQAKTPQFKNLEKRTPCFTAEMVAAEQAAAEAEAGSAAPASSPDAKQFAGTYSLIDGPNSNTIKISPQGDKLRVAYELNHTGPNPATGEARGMATISGTVAKYEKDACTILLELQPKGRLKVTSRSDSGTCGFGGRTLVDGTYDKVRTGKSKATKSRKK